MNTQKREGLRLNKKLIILSLVLFCLSLFLAFVIQIRTNDISRVKIKGQDFIIELAKTKEERAKGLSNREGLCQKCGMLFVFPGEGEYSFHMKNMKFPLDIIWILEDRIVHIERSVPADFRGSLQPEVHADMVLEVNAGISENLELDVGDAI